MNGVDALLRGHPYDPVDIQVGLHRPFPFTHQVGFVRLEAMQGQPVLLGIDGDCAQAEFVGRPQNPYGDFAAIES